MLLALLIKPSQTREERRHRVLLSVAVIQLLQCLVPASGPVSQAWGPEHAREQMKGQNIGES